MKKIVLGALLAGGLTFGGIGASNASEWSAESEGFGSADIQLFGESGIFGAMALMPDLGSDTILSISISEYDTSGADFTDFLSLGASLGLQMGVTGFNDFLNNDIVFDGDEEPEDEIIVTGTRNGDPWAIRIYPDALAMLGITIDEYLYGPGYNVAAGVTNVQIGDASNTSNDSDNDNNTDIPTDEVPPRPTGEISLGAFDQFMRECRRAPGCSYTVTVSGPIHMT